MRSINQTSYANVRKQRLKDYVTNNCTPQQDTDFWDQVELECTERSLRKMNETRVRFLANVVCYQVNGVKEVVEESRYSY